MPSVLSEMHRIGNEHIELYGSDMLWDAYIIGRDAEKRSLLLEYIWVVRKCGTHIIHIQDARSSRRNSILEYWLNSRDEEAKFFYLKDPTTSTEQGGKIFEISADTVKEIMKGTPCIIKAKEIENEA
jgi:hypothetical protein